MSHQNLDGNSVVGLYTFFLLYGYFFTQHLDFLIKRIKSLSPTSLLMPT